MMIEKIMTKIKETDSIAELRSPSFSPLIMSIPISLSFLFPSVLSTIFLLSLLPFAFRRSLFRIFYFVFCLTFFPLFLFYSTSVFFSLLPPPKINDNCKNNNENKGDRLDYGITVSLFSFLFLSFTSVSPNFPLFFYFILSFLPFSSIDFLLLFVALSFAFFV